MRITIESLIAAAALVFFTTGCNRISDKPVEVVVYSSVDEVFARPVAERFSEDTGIAVRLVPDTEETKSTGLLNRLIAERERPQADVFWSGDPVRAAILKSKGVSEPYRSPNAARLPALYSDAEGHWTGFAARARVLIYNKELVAQGEEPRSVLDLYDPRFQGKACIANPLFGTTSMHAAALFQMLGEEKARDFFQRFTKNGGSIVSESEAAQMPVRPGVAVPDYVRSLDEIQPMQVHYGELAGLLERLSAGFLREWVEANSR